MLVYHSDCSHMSNLSHDIAVPIHACPPKNVILVAVSTILLLLLHILFCLSTWPLLPASHLTFLCPEGSTIADVNLKISVKG